MKLAPETWIMICDGQKYLLLENKGDEDVLNLQTVDHGQLDPAELATDGLERPGVFQGSAMRRGSGETASVHDIAEQRFVAGIARRLDDWALEDRFHALVVVADKTTLGTLRARVSEHVTSRTIREIGNDIVHETIPDIEAFIQKA